MGSTWKEQQQDGMPEIPGYRLMRILGHGGMSTVYLGQQLSLGREVAIKLMRQEALTDEIGRRRFENEARTIREAGCRLAQGDHFGHAQTVDWPLESFAQSA